MQRIIKILSESFLIKKPIDNYLKNYFRVNKNMGSRDRSFVSDTVFGVVRNYKKLLQIAGTPDIEKLVEIYLKNPEMESDVLEYPDFLIEKIDRADLEFMQQEDTPHVDIRVNTLKSSVDKVMKDLAAFNPTKLKSVYNGIRISKRVDLNTIKSFKSGHFEIQDEGSQLVSSMIKIGDNILDYCAGAGGKSLFLADKMRNKGEIIAHDIVQTKLDELNKRAKRQGIDIINTRYPFDFEPFDTVLVDAPCSGSGTFRRNPDAKWRISEDKIADLVNTGHDILKKVKNNVKSGGFLTFITCSLIKDENEGQIATFLSENKDFELLEMKTIKPSEYHTDGFFIANLKKK